MASRGHKKALKSATYGKSVPPSEKRQKRTTSSATVTQRVAMQPPVCGVQPGKALELKTSLGILRAKELIAQQQEEQRRVEEAGDDLTLMLKASATRGQLKHGRLQPLGVVSDSVFLPTDCLGVIPVSPKVKSEPRKQRPRSSTTPGIHFGIPDSSATTHHRYERVGAKVNLKRRSYSAVLTRQLRTEQLLQMLSISKHTGLVPSGTNGQMEDGSESHKGTQERQLHSPRNNHSTPEGILPPVVQHGELGMTIKVQKLRKNVGDKSTHVSTPQKSTSSQADSHFSTSKKSNPDSSSDLSQPKLPQIQSSPEASKEDSSTPPKSSPSSQSVQESSVAKNSMTSTSPMKVSIVSIGETTSNRVESRSKVVKPKRHPSGKQNGGRLSLGWSPPQPIEPLKGSPLNTPTKKVTFNSQFISPPPATDDEDRPSTPGMMINVDVNEFLLDLDET